MSDRPGEAAAVEAAWNVSGEGVMWEEVTLMVAAAYPVIEAAVRADEKVKMEADYERMRQELIRVYRLSSEALSRPDKTLTVYELNRALRDV